MKKRIVLLVSVLCLLIALPIVFGACSSVEEHRFSEDWANDDTYHWHPATCGHENEVSDKAEHTWNGGVAGAEGTVYTCTVCGRVKTVAADPGAHTHDWVESGVIAPTCTEKGYTTYTCACGETRLDDEVGALGHQIATLTANGDGTHSGYCEREQMNVTESCGYASSVTSPLCTQQGYTTYTCACGDKYRDDYTEALGHSHSQKLEFNDVYHWYEATCSHTTEKLEFAPHTYTQTVTAPTCSEQGYTTYACACGYSYKGDYVAATGHAVETWVESETTVYDVTLCKSAVLYRGECKTCHEEQTKTEYVEKHSFYWEITTPATCVANGVKTKLCNNEGCKYHTANSACETQSYSDLEAHVWEEDAEHSTTNVTVYQCAHHASVTKSIMSAADSSVNVSGSELEGVNELEFPEASLGFDQSIKDKLVGNGEINISAGTLDDSGKQTAIADANLSPEDLALLGDNPIYSFTITAGTEIKDLGGTATVRIPYTLTPGQNPEQIVVWYIADGKLEAVKATYGVDAHGKGYVTFTTTHFSCYVPAELSAEQYCEIYDHSDETFTVAPTCTESGYTICLHCGKQIASVAPTGHNLHSVVSKAPTCDANGVMHFSCDGCDVAYDAAIPATGHYYVLHDHETATCQSAGSDTYRCVYCDDQYTVSIKQLSHNHTVTVVEPTCTSAGYTQKLCKACGDTVVLNHKKPLAHSYSDIWTGAEEGHYHVCTVCGVRGDVEAHKPGAEATEQSAQICTVCEYVITPPIAHVHKLTAVAAVEADCTHGGNLAYYTCECGKWFLDANAQQLVVDHTSIYLLAKGHTPANMDPVTPTCEDVGYTAGIECSVCHEILKGHDEIRAYGHRHVATVIAPTCTTGGYTDYVCACGDAYRDDETDPLEHNYVSAVTAPTCTEKGFTTHTCTRCADSYVDAHTDALEHKPGMTLSYDEEQHWIACTRCGDKLQAAAHTPDFEEATIEHGVTCTLCGYELEAALPHAHTPAETFNGKAPTCISSGVKTYHVCICGKRFEDTACEKEITDLTTVILPATGHTPESVNATESTCLQHGYTAGEYCSACQTWISGHEEKPLADHNYQNGSCTVCGAKTAIYTYTEQYDNTTILYEFFADNIVRGYMETVMPDGTIETEEDFAEWIQKDGLIVIVFEGETFARFTVNEDGKTLTLYEEPSVNREILYTYEFTQEGILGLYEFYTDNTICAFITYDDGKTIQDWAEWRFDGEELVIEYEGEIVERFTVGEDGKTLTRVEEDGEGDNNDPPVYKEIRYTYEFTQDGILGLYEFYTDNTICVFITYDDGKTIQDWAEWRFDGEELVIEYEGEIVERFTVGEDGKTLTPCEVDDNEKEEPRYICDMYDDDVHGVYRFYADFTVSVSVDYADEQIVIWAEWTWIGDEIVIFYEGEEDYHFTVNEDGKTVTRVDEDNNEEPDQPGPGESQKLIVYFFEFEEEGWKIRFEFYNDGTMYAYETDGTGEKFEIDGTWVKEDEKISVTIDGETETLFTVGEDGKTLIPYEGDSSEAALLYTSTMSEGSIFVRFEFYSDYCVKALIYERNEDGTLSELIMENRADWQWVGDEIVIFYEGEEDYHFTMNEDGKTLTIVPDDSAEPDVPDVPDEPVKQIVYTYEGIVDGAMLKLVLYSDFSCSATRSSADGYMMAFFCNWRQNLNSVTVISGLLGDLDFTVNEDGKTLTLIGSGNTEEPVEPDQPVEPEKPDDPDMAIRYLFDEEIEGVHVRYEFYDNGWILASVIDHETGKSYDDWANWRLNGEYVEVVYEGEVVQQFTVNEDDYTLTPVDTTPDGGCAHKSVIASRVNPTCTEDGYEQAFCEDCGEKLIDEWYPALGHSFDENGYCVNCGEGGSDEDFSIIVENTINDCNNEWNAFVEANDVNLLENYSQYLKNYRTFIRYMKESSSMEELEAYKQEIRDLIDLMERELHGTPIEPPVQNEVYYYYDDCRSFVFYDNGEAEIDVTEYAADGTSISWHDTVSWTEENGRIVIMVGEKTYHFVVMDGASLWLESVQDAIDQELSDRIGEVLKEMESRWNGLYSYEAFVSNGLEAKYSTQYHNIYARVETATSVVMVERYYVQFENLINQIMDRLVADDETVALRQETLDWMDGKWGFYTVAPQFHDLPNCDYYYNWFDAIYKALKGALAVTEINDLRCQAEELFAAIDRELESVCLHETKKEIERCDSTCGTSGYVVYQCPVCGESFEETVFATGNHNYQDGKCLDCGQVAENTEVNLAVQIRVLSSRMSSTWRKYTDTTALKDLSEYDAYQTKYMSLYNSLKVSTSMAELEGISAEFDALIADIEKMLESAPESCKHENMVVETEQEGDCVNEGFIAYVCVDCGYHWLESFGFGDHMLDERGCCEMCDYCEHRNMTVWESMEANCMQGGIRSVSCDTCGQSWNEDTPRTEHRLDEKGFCNMCGMPCKKTIYNVIYWNNTGTAYQRYYFYEDLTGYAFETYASESGYYAVSGQIEFTWDTDGMIVNMYLEDEMVGSFTVLEDGSLEPNMGDDKPVEPENPDMGDDKPVEPENPDIYEPVVPDVPVTPDVPGSGEIENPEFTYVVHFFKDVIDGQTVEIRFYSDYMADINLYIPCDDGSTEYVSLKGDWYLSGDQVYLNFEGGLVTFTLSDGKLSLNGAQDDGNADVPVNPDDGWSDNSGSTDNDKPDDGADDNESSTNKPDVSYDFGGEEITIMVPDESAHNWDMVSDDSATDILNFQVYQRNMYTQEKLNVCLQFHYVSTGKYNRELENMVLAGDDSIDLVSFNAIQVN